MVIIEDKKVKEEVKKQQRPKKKFPKPEIALGGAQKDQEMGIEDEEDMGKMKIFNVFR